MTNLTDSLLSAIAALLIVFIVLAGFILYEENLTTEEDENIKILSFAIDRHYNITITTTNKDYEQVGDYYGFSGSIVRLNHTSFKLTTQLIIILDTYGDFSHYTIEVSASPVYNVSMAILGNSQILADSFSINNLVFN